jgi:hypothetical protein
MFGGGGPGSAELPRLVQVRVQRHQRQLPRRGAPLAFLVSVHLEASVLTWQTDVTVPESAERAVLDAVTDLHRWSTGDGLTIDLARSRVVEVGELLRDTFLGDGTDVVAALRPTALVLEIDETILGLPWELVLDAHDEPWSLQVPTGRVVTTRTRPQPSRDPIADDANVTILVVVPDSDLVAVDEEIGAIEGLPDHLGRVGVTVEVLRGRAATRRGLARALDGRDVEIVHVAGHGAAGASGGVRLGDGWLRPADVAALPWSAPPYLVVASACESARVAQARRLVGRRAANGLASAFLARGCGAYAGHYWPVDDGSAAVFSQVFYETLFRARNVGAALHEARRALHDGFERSGDLAGFGAVFFGDVGTSQRADLATAV